MTARGSGRPVQTTRMEERTSFEVPTRFLVQLPRRRAPLPDRLP